MSYVRGIDISAYDPYIDWQKVRAQGIRFAIIKATEGTHYSQPYFSQQWVGAKSVGVLRGAYHYLRAQVDGAKQADFFLSKLNFQESDFPAFLDIEGKFNETATNNDFINNTQKWLQRVEEATGRRPIVYSTARFLTSKLSLNGKAPAWASKYQTWIAQYFYSYSAEGGGKPDEAAGWGNWIFWQYSGDHDTLDGVYKDAAMTQKVFVDLDVYRYSLDELYKLARAAPPAEDVVAAPAAYTIKAGDTLHSIANSNQLSLDDLIRANPQLIREGLQINLPGSGNEGPANPPPPPATLTYTVRPGDTLIGIALRFGVAVDALIRLNDIANPDLISVGQALKIPPK
jgi:GH25 family lysozyme M1 (1,4-beta-N-acetylmuramidase)/LysM repeat protein